MTVPVQWWPAAPTVDAYVAIWLGRPYGRYFLKHSLAVASATDTACRSALAALAGYGFSRYRFRGASSTR